MAHNKMFIISGLITGISLAIVAVIAVRVYTTTITTSPQAYQTKSVIFFTVSQCAACDDMRLYLNKHSINFIEKNADVDLNVNQEFVTIGITSAPSILVGEHLLHAPHPWAVSACIKHLLIC